MRSNSSNKESVLAVTLLLLLMFLYWRNLYVIYSAAVLIVISLLFNKVAELIDLAWKRITQALGWVSSTIILTILFYGIVFPMGAMLKLFNKNPLLLKKDNLATTFITRNKLFTKTDLQNPF